MKINDSLDDLLRSWRYEEGNNVRRVALSEGREVLQVRQPLGIEQYEIDGRPDGLRPEGRDSWFEVYRERSKHEGTDWTLDAIAVERLREESLLYYYRYVVFFQTKDYARCARDTSRNLEVLDFLAKFGTSERATGLEQYRPYVVRMHFMARALEELNDRQAPARAVELLRVGRRRLERMTDDSDSAVFRSERQNSLEVLEKVENQLRELVPPSERDRLEARLEAAIAVENYEEAARLRDRLARLGDDRRG